LGTNQFWCPNPQQSPVIAAYPRGACSEALIPPPRRFQRLFDASGLALASLHTREVAGSNPAGRLLGYEHTITLTPSQQGTYRRAMRMTREHGP